MKKGFTLSEVLITLGIIGVIAALTIPAIVTNYRNKIYVAQLKRVYGQITEAAQTIMTEEQTDNFYTTSAGIPQDNTGENCKTGACYFLRNYFKTMNENCATGDHPCVGDSYKGLNGTALTVKPGGSFCAQTTNGATICATHNTNNQVTSITVDVNGKDDPNTAGRDVFSMDIHKNGSISDYSSGCADNNFGCTADRCNAGGAGDGIYGSACGCLTAVMEAGWKMEY